MDCNVSSEVEGSRQNVQICRDWVTYLQASQHWVLTDSGGNLLHTRPPHVCYNTVILICLQMGLQICECIRSESLLTSRRSHFLNYMTVSNKADGDACCSAFKEVKTLSESAFIQVTTQIDCRGNLTHCW